MAELVGYENKNCFLANLIYYKLRQQKKKKENMLKEKRYDYHTSGQASEEVYSRMEERI